jgi:molybdenum cofactor guanylyltransferase
MNVSAVILAGGQSRRMGQDKAWILFQGRPLLRAAVELLRSLPIREILVAGRVGQDYSSMGCRTVLDRQPGLGPLSGIESALRQARFPRVLVLPVDLPCMTAECLGELLAACKGDRGAVASLQEDWQPLVAVYPARCHAEASIQLAHGDYAVRHFVAACLRRKEVALWPVPFHFTACFRNCNAPADLAAVRDSRPLAHRL